MFRAISFDLQGTLSDSRFSDEFWMTLLPKLYADHNDVPLAQAKADLKEKFSQLGKYDYRYYCARYWLKKLCPGKELKDMVSQLSNQPSLYPDTLELIVELKNRFPLIILSTTTHDFIELELKDKASHFTHVFSSLDDFGIAGKTTLSFEKAAQNLKLSPKELLHIGDCQEMDIKNAAAAGCQTLFWDKTKSRAECILSLKQCVGANSVTA